MSSYHERRPQNSTFGVADVDSRVIAFDSVEDPHFRTVLDYWSLVRGARFAPPWATFDLLGLPSTVIPSMTVVDLLPGKENFRYRFWGTRQAAFKARDYTGLTVRDLRPEAVATAVTEQYTTVIDARAPLAFRHTVRSAKMGVSMTQTTIRMPMSNDGEIVDMVASYCIYPQPVHEVRQVFADHLGDLPED